MLICQQVEKDFENESENGVHDGNAPPSKREQTWHRPTDTSDERSLNHPEEKLKQENENGTFHVLSLRNPISKSSVRIQYDQTS